VIFCILLFGLNLSLSCARADYSWATQSNWTETAPVQDGYLDTVYQTYGPQIAWYIVPVSAHITGFNYVYILNDAQFLYLFFDIVSDNSTEPSDTLFLFFDSNNDEQTVDPDDTFFIDREDELFLNYLNYTFSSSPNGAHDHVQWEVRLNLSAFTTAIAPGDVIGYLFAVYGTLTPQHYYPANNYDPLTMGDESTYNKLRLATLLPNDYSTLIWIIILCASVVGTIIITYLFMRRKS
jgi:hypothetical protein